MSEVASVNANIITLNQDMPIKDYAFITLTIDVSKISVGLDELIDKLKQLENVKKVELIAFEG